jgi:hypothetical protein
MIAYALKCFFVVRNHIRYLAESGYEPLRWITGTRELLGMKRHGHFVVSGSVIRGAFVNRLTILQRRGSSHTEPSPIGRVLC